MIRSHKLLFSTAFILLACLLAFAGMGSNTAVNAQPLAEAGVIAPPTAPKYGIPPAVVNPPEHGILPATPCVGGDAAGYPCSNIDLLAFMPIATIGGGSRGNDSWGWTDPLDGTEYVIMGRNDGTAFVDISDPENPIYVGNLPTHTTATTWRDMKVYDNHAFIVSEASGHGIQIFDLTQLSSVVTPPVTFANTAHFDGFGSAHNIVINEDSGYAYGVGAGTCGGGLHMVNIISPTNPIDAGCFSADGYTHDAQCIIYNGPDSDHVGSEICFNANEDTLTIVDVTTKTNPIQLARVGYSGTGYTHQGWVTDDHAYFLLDDETDETGNGHNTRTYLWNITDLDDPIMFDIHESQIPSSDHNQYVKGNYTYQANYSGGLRILDITDIANGNLSEVAYFDTHPANNNAGFPGAWSNYPYFDSGVIAISNDTGLFLVRPNLTPDFSLAATPNQQEVCIPDDAIYDITVGDLNGFVGQVTLTTPNLPAGLNATFDPALVTVAGTSVMTVSTSGATADTYNIDVTAMSPTLTHTTTVGLILNDGAPDSAPTLTTPDNEATSQPTNVIFEWEAVDGATGYAIDIATDAGFTTIVDSATGLTDPNYTSNVLTTATTYYWRVRANNLCGTTADSEIWSFTTIDTSGACPAGTTAEIAYEYDFEAGEAGWVHQGVDFGAGVVDTWQLSTANANSGVTAWHGEDWSARSDQRLASPEIALGPAPILYFENIQRFEAPDPDGCWDAGVLEISIDGGATWQYIDNSHMLTDPYDDEIWDNTFDNNPLVVDYGFSPMAWCDPSAAAFETSLVDLSDWAGETARLRWRLASDNFVGAEGWYIDDVRVQSCVAAAYDVAAVASSSPNVTTTTGTTATYTVMITNEGTASDSFSLDVMSNWDATASMTNTGILSAGESVTVTVNVTVPTTATNGAMNTATLTITSDGDDNVSTTVDMSTTAQWYQLFLPVQFKN